MFVTSSLNLSPFITHTHLKLPNATIRDAVIEKLVNGSASSEEGSSGRGLALNFIRGSDLQCDWSGTGLGEERPENENPSKGGLAESLSGGGMGSSFRGLKSVRSTLHGDNDFFCVCCSCIIGSFCLKLLECDDSLIVSFLA